jgi:hypothetical protein
MSDKQTAVEYLLDEFIKNGVYLSPFFLQKFREAKEMYKDEMDAAIIKVCAEQSTSEASKYAQGYKEGYKRAIELSKWTLSNLIPPYNEQ